MKKAEKEARIAGIYKEAERIAKHRGTTTAAKLCEWAEDHRWRAGNTDQTPDDAEDVKTATLAAELTEAALARAEETEKHEQSGE